MAYDEGMAQILRESLDGFPRISEKKMFGGLCFLLDGNMLCGVHKGGAMFRVGKANEAEALSIPGAGPMTFTGRRMGGMIDVTDEAVLDDVRRAKLQALAIEFVGMLPAK